ncbi:hypothetical protein G7Y79_00008g024300 [Physcia stellaris]|nr:hypothetical protein G7Y79_00008g024300 [Physcia stellaris]
MSFITNCTICNKPNAKLCTQCKSAAYCSSLCQETDWSTHKLLCKAFGTKGDRPSSDHYLAILLPEQSQRPRLVWVKHEYIPGDEIDPSWYKPDILELLSEIRPADCEDRRIIHRNELRDFSMNDTVWVYFRDSALTDGSSSSQSLIEITKDQHRHEWRGPIVVIRSEGITLDPLGCKDVTLADLRCAADYFIAYGADERGTDPKYPGFCVEGVKISCVGDKVIHGDQRFSALRVPMDHPMFRNETSIPISRLLEMPLLAHQLRPETTWKNDGDFERFQGRWPYDNEAATFLHMDSNPDSDGWGWAPMRWQSRVGSVLVVRQDLKPLVPEHIDVLCDYCQSTLQPIFEASLEGSRSKEDVVNFITRKKMGELFELYRKEMVDCYESEQEMERWKNLPSVF